LEVQPDVLSDVRLEPLTVSIPISTVFAVHRSLPMHRMPDRCPGRRRTANL
jgi:hypothetical protein